jgi:hypothetical protein
MTPIQGGCLCRAVRFTASVEPLVARACWCRVCRHLASGNATINLAFPSNAVSITGELRDYSNTAESGNHMHRRFCPHCGVHLFSAAEERPQLLIVRLGTLDDPTPFAPQANIWTSEAPSWARIDADMPGFERQPPAPLIKQS